VNFQVAIIRQYHSSLAMMAMATELCPEPLWLEGSPNRFWQVAYHALYYADLYLSQTEADFTPQAFHSDGSHMLDASRRDAQEPSVVDRPYTRSEILGYVDYCQSRATTQVQAMDLRAPSGFSWLPFEKLELQIYNIRHLQHHTGQLTERLRTRDSCCSSDRFADLDLSHTTSQFC
jgi:hypothetical protein